MDNNEILKDELKKIKNEIYEQKREIGKIGNIAEKNFFRKTLYDVTIIGTIGTLILVLVAIKTKNDKYDKVILYNDDSAVIFDITSDDSILVDEKNSSVIYVDEDAGISANDIAVSLVGEDGTVYYYNSETKEKELVNKKIYK